MLCVVVEFPSVLLTCLCVIETCDVAFCVICIYRKERVGTDGIVERVPIDVTLSDTAVCTEAVVESLTYLEDVETVSLDYDMV